MGLAEEIKQIAIKEFAKKRKLAIAICRQETPIDKGDLESTVREEFNNPLEVEFVWGNKQGPNTYVDYQAFVQKKGTFTPTPKLRKTGGAIWRGVPNLYHLKAKKRIENEV
jgi:hypothetical protein